jgi:hypothetical protein
MLLAFPDAQRAAVLAVVDLRFIVLHAIEEPPISRVLSRPGGGGSSRRR